VRCAGFVLLALALTGCFTGCETTAEESARLERVAKREQAKHPGLDQKGLSITHQSTIVKVLATAVLHGPEADAAVVTLRSSSSHALTEVPIEITVKGAHGQTLYANNTGGLETALVAVPSIPPHGQVEWIDDQLPAGHESASVSARVGEGVSGGTSMPSVAVTGVHLAEGSPTGPAASGTVANHSTLAQPKLVIYAVGRRGGKIVAAGRALLPELGAGGSSYFQVFFVGNPQGAQLDVTPAPTVLGR
jgi:hypothetical protein